MLNDTDADSDADPDPDPDAGTDAGRRSSLVLDYRGKQRPEARDSADSRRRVIAAAVLEGFDFVESGL